MTAAASDKPAPMKVRDLLAILADCDLDATVDLGIPMFIDESDRGIVADPDALAGEYTYRPSISASFMTSKEVPYETFFHEDGRTRNGAKPNHVSISLHEDDIEGLISSRQRAIERATESGSMEPEPAVGDAETVIVDLAIPRSLHATIRELLHSVNMSSRVRNEQACTHGPLTVAGLFSMLAEDVGMVESRPGCWEASNMAQVLISHGYPC